jgi:hypothetical protein
MKFGNSLWKTVFLRVGNLTEYLPIVLKWVILCHSSVQSCTLQLLLNAVSLCHGHTFPIHICCLATQPLCLYLPSSGIFIYLPCSSILLCCVSALVVSTFILLFLFDVFFSVSCSEPSSGYFIQKNMAILSYSVVCCHQWCLLLKSLKFFKFIILSVAIFPSVLKDLATTYLSEALWFHFNRTDDTHQFHEREAVCADAEHILCVQACRVCCCHCDWCGPALYWWVLASCIRKAWEDGFERIHNNMKSLPLDSRLYMHTLPLRVRTHLSQEKDKIDCKRRQSVNSTNNNSTRYS